MKEVKHTPKIQKGVPIPKDPKGRKLKYPYSNMSVGDSFLAIGIKKNTLLGGAQSWAKRNKKKWEFTIRTESKGIRIWRTK